MAALAAIVAWRAWPWLSQPLLALEDGAVFFAGHFAEWRLSALFEPYAGYLPVGTNLSAMLLCRLPTSWIPVAFVLASAVMLFGCAATLLRPAWQVVAPFGLRFLMALALVALPFGSNLEFTSIAYAQWPQLLWLFFLLLEPGGDESPERRTWLLRRGWVVVLTITHPLAVILLPLGLVASVRNARRADYYWFAVALVGYWLLGLFLLEESVEVSFASLADHWLDALCFKVLVEGLVGVAGAEALVSWGVAVWLPVVVSLVLGVATLCWLAWSRWSPAARLFAIACAWLLSASLAASLATRPDWVDSAQYAVRYAWLGRATLWCVLLLSLGALWRAWVALAVVGVFSVVLVFGNARLHWHPGQNIELRGFLQDLQEQEREAGNRRACRARLDRGGRMPIVIRPR